MIIVTSMNKEMKTGQFCVLTKTADITINTTLPHYGVLRELTINLFLLKTCSDVGLHVQVPMKFIMFLKMESQLL